VCYWYFYSRKHLLVVSESEVLTLFFSVLGEHESKAVLEVSLAFNVVLICQQ